MPSTGLPCLERAAACSSPDSTDYVFKRQQLITVCCCKYTAAAADLAQHVGEQQSSRLAAGAAPVEVESWCRWCRWATAPAWTTSEARGGPWTQLTIPADGQLGSAGGDVRGWATLQLVTY